APHAAGEIENLAEAAPPLDGVELLAKERHAHFAGYEEVEAVALVGLPDDDGSRVHGLPAADLHDLPQGDVVEVLEKRHVAQLVELLRIGNRRPRKAQRREGLAELLAELEPGPVASSRILLDGLHHDLV